MPPPRTAVSDAQTRGKASREIDSLYENAPFGFGFLDRNLRYLRVNHCLARLNRRPAAEHLGRTVGEVIPDLAPRLEPHLRRVLEAGEPILGVDVRCAATTSDVQQCWRASFLPVLNADGSVLGVNVIVQDVSRYIEMEERLGDRLRFETLLSDFSAGLAHVPVSELDVAIGAWLERIALFLDVDRTAVAQFSSDGRELRLTHAWARPGIPPLPPAFLSQDLPWYTERVRNGEILVLNRLPADLPPEAATERRYMASEGVKAHLTIPLSVGGRAIGILGFSSFREGRVWPQELLPRLQLLGGILANALLRARGERALRDSEERFRQMADAAPMLVWMSGPDKGCVYFNQRWLDFTGRTHEEEIGDGWAQGVHPDDRDECVRTYTSAFEDRRPFTMEYRLHRHDGEYRWILDTGAPRFEPGGGFGGYLGSCVDITEQKRSEEALRELSGHLLQAHESERARIARDLHDDFNQRLALLAVDLEMLADEERPDGLRSELHALSARVKDLSSDVQQLSRQLHPAKISQLGLVSAVKSFCREISGQRGIQVGFSHGDVPRNLPDDVSLCLYRVVQEALRNVVKHSGAGEARVSLADEAGGIRLVVSDDGAGFDPGAASGQGGLGFVSMQERLRLVGGQIEIRSQPGRGTRVVAWTPLAAEEVPEAGDGPGRKDVTP